MSVSRKLRKKQLEEDLNNFTKEELILRVQQLTAHNSQLINVINKKLEDVSNTEKKSKKGRDFDFSKCCKRHIFLKLLYLGWDYQGFATQEDTHKTIEWELFEALRKSCLIEDRTTSNYHRCGRTDKGVSAFGQVISIDIRSRAIKKQGDDSINLTEAVGGEAYVINSEENVSNQKSTTKHPIEPYVRVEGELEYCKILNRLLPPSIRAVAWSPVPPEESARFNCRQRTYKYFFPRGNLNLQNMAKAAAFLVGEHDFRNLCKMDVANGVVNFQRTISNVSIQVVAADQVNSCKDVINSSISRVEGMHKVAKYSRQIIGFRGEIPESDENYVKIGQKCDSQEGMEKCCSSGVQERDLSVKHGKSIGRGQTVESPYDMCELTVVGQAFLWHQIRCIISVLFLVGQGKEDPGVIKNLLDVENFPRKPQYGLASEIPLNLFNSEFETSLNWVYDREGIFSIIKDLQKEWTLLSVRSTMIRQMVSELEGSYEDLDDSELTNCLLQGVRPRSYVPLLQRNTCESLEDRIDHYVKRKRLEIDDS